MQTVTYTKLTENSDHIEGKGHTQVVAYFTDENEASIVMKDERYYKQHGVWGQPMSKYDISTETIRIYESAEEFWGLNDVERLKESALKKLTAAERQVLGL